MQAGEQTLESRRLLGHRVTAAPLPPPGPSPTLSGRRAQVVKLVLPSGSLQTPLRADAWPGGFSVMEKAS